MSVVDRKKICILPYVPIYFGQFTILQKICEVSYGLHIN